MMHCSVAGEAQIPPAAPTDGECWLVDTDAQGQWAGHSGNIACHYGGNWLFMTPSPGMRAFNRSTGQDLRYDGAWLSPDAPETPSGGAIVDAEARSAIATLIGRLREAGIFAAS